MCCPVKSRIHPHRCFWLLLHGFQSSSGTYMWHTACSCTLGSTQPASTECVSEACPPLQGTRQFRRQSHKRLATVSMTPQQVHCTAGSSCFAKHSRHQPHHEMLVHCLGMSHCSVYVTYYVHSAIIVDWSMLKRNVQDPVDCIGITFSQIMQLS